MNLEEDIRPVTYLKSRAADLLAQINETRRPVVITQNGEPRGVLQDPQTYARMRDSLSLLKLLAQGDEEVRAGRTVPQAKVLADARQVLDQRRPGRGRA